MKLQYFNEDINFIIVFLYFAKYVRLYFYCAYIALWGSSGVSFSSFRSLVLFAHQFNLVLPSCSSKIFGCGVFNCSGFILQCFKPQFWHFFKNSFVQFFLEYYSSVVCIFFIRFSAKRLIFHNIIIYV